MKQVLFRMTDWLMTPSICVLYRFESEHKWEQGVNERIVKKQNNRCIQNQIQKLKVMLINLYMIFVCTRTCYNELPQHFFFIAGSKFIFMCTYKHVDLLRWWRSGRGNIKLYKKTSWSIIFTRCNLLRI